MISELIEQYGVRSFSAVLKRENRRSLRLLQRLGFALASSSEHAEWDVERDEFLMLRHVQSA